MLCPSCKKEGFPIDLRCLKCDEPLPAVPHIFESPENRLQPPKKVFCTKCGLEAADARLACPECLATLPRPFSLVAGHDPEFEDEPQIARFEIVCPEGACAECMKLDGKIVTREEVKRGVVPIPACLHPMCWCNLVGVYDDEGKVTTSD